MTVLPPSVSSLAYWASSCRACSISGIGRLTSRPGGASESDSVVGADVVFEFGESDFDEFFGGIHAVVWLETFMVEFAIGDLHEEADDGSSAICLFCDNLG